MGRSTFGSVFTRKARGATWYWVRFQQDGRNVRKKCGTTKKSADDELARLRAARVQGEKDALLGIIGPGRLEFSGLWPLVEPLLLARLSPANVAIQKLQFGVAEAHFGKDTLVRDIGVPEIEKFLDHVVTGRGCSPATRNRYRASLSAWWKVAVAEGFAAQNVARAARAIREQARVPEFLGEREIERIVARAPERFRPLYVLLADTGLRRSEGLRLGWQDIDFRRGVLVVRVSKSKRTREIPLTSRAREALLGLLEERGPIPMDGPSPVFPWISGYKSHALAERRATLAFRNAATKANLKGVRLHDLRHSFCSRLVMRGVPLNVVMQLAGHSSLTVTTRYASHVPGGAAAAAISALEAPAPVVAAPAAARAG